MTRGKQKICIRNARVPQAETSSSIALLILGNAVCRIDEENGRRIYWSELRFSATVLCILVSGIRRLQQNTYKTHASPHDRHCKAVRNVG